MGDKEIEDLYDRIAKDYDEIRKKPCLNSLIEMPATLSLIEDVKGKKILDAGCGTGIYTEILGQKGADLVGIDISDEMLKIAKKRYDKAQYHKCSIDDLCFPDKSFDVIVSGLTVHYLKDLTKVFSEFERVLKDNGYAVISVFHPSRSLLKKNTYFTDKKIWETWDNGIDVYYYNHTFQDYTEKILASGLKIEKIMEPQPVDGAKVNYPRFYQKHYEKPECLVIKMRKEGKPFAKIY